MPRTLIALSLAVIAPLAQAVPETYVIDPTHTAARFEYNHLDWTRQLHRFDQTAGRITVDLAARTASVDVSIDAKSVNTGFSVFNGHLQGPDFFDAVNHPNITFQSTGVKFDGDKVVSVDGNLTIKGITRPVTLQVQSFRLGSHPVQSKRQSIGVNAVASVKRSDFNMSKVPAVSDEVSLSFAVQAFKE